MLPMSRRLNREFCADVPQAKSGKLPLQKPGASWSMDQLRIGCTSFAPFGYSNMLGQ